MGRVSNGSLERLWLLRPPCHPIFQPHLWPSCDVRAGEVSRSTSSPRGSKTCMDGRRQWDADKGELQTTTITRRARASAPSVPMMGRGECGPSAPRMAGKCCPVRGPGTRRQFGFLSAPLSFAFLLPASPLLPYRTLHPLPLLLLPPLAASQIPWFVPALILKSTSNVSSHTRRNVHHRCVPSGVSRGQAPSSPANFLRRLARFAHVVPGG